MVYPWLLKGYRFRDYYHTVTMARDMPLAIEWNPSNINFGLWLKCLHSACAGVTIRSASRILISIRYFGPCLLRWLWYAWRKYPSVYIIYNALMPCCKRLWIYTQFPIAFWYMLRIYTANNKYESNYKRNIRSKQTPNQVHSIFESGSECNIMPQ